MHRFVLLSLVGIFTLSACDSLNVDAPDLPVYRYRAEMTVEKTISCEVERDAPTGHQSSTTVGSGGASATIGPAIAARVTCTGESDTGTLHVELLADGAVVDTAATTTPSEGAIVVHQSQ